MTQPKIMPLEVGEDGLEYSAPVSKWLNTSLAAWFVFSLF